MTSTFPKFEILSLLSKVRRTARRVADLVPVTLLGFLVAGLAAAGLYWLGMQALDMVLLIVGYVALALVVIAVLMVSVTTAFVDVALRRARRTAATGETLETHRFHPTGFECPSPAWLPLVRVRFEWFDPDGVVSRPVRKSFSRAAEEVRFRERGEVREVVRRIIIEDVMGLARIAVRETDHTRYQVLPAALGLRSMPILVSMAGGDELPHPMGIDDGDRVELRRYVAGDPARFIHWKVFGRTRKLMVRMPERALSRSRRTVAYLVAGPQDEASAAAARVAVESGALLGEWRFGADGSPEIVSDADAARDLIVRSVAARTRGGEGLRSFLEQVDKEGPATLVLFVPATPGPWIDRVLAAMRTSGRRVRVVVTFDALLRETRAQKVWRYLSLDDAAGQGTRAGLDEVCRRMAAAHGEVVVLDRPSGRLWSSGSALAAAVGRAA